MNILVTDQGFSPLTHAAYAVIKTFAADTDPATITAEVFTADLIRIEFASFADGRGFTLARLLRLRGFRGALHAYGHVISDQYAMARRSGFDAVEITNTLAARQPQQDWLARANWQAHDYQSRLGKSA